MPKLITWNIQSARTPEGGADVGQVPAALDRFSDFDILCLQEVASGFPARDGSPGGDQFAELTARFPGYTPMACVAVDTLAPDGSRQRLGSMVFSRYPVLQVLRHSLPWPSDPGVMSMPRCALELTLQTPRGLLRVLSCHLEYFSPLQRMAQVAQLRTLQREAVLHALHPRPGKGDAGAFAATARPVPAVFAGDFNMLPDSSEHALLLAPFTDGTPALRDAWHLVHPGRAHAPTVGLRDSNPGAGTPFTFDFAFVSSDLAPRVRRMAVDEARTGSDHQGLLLEFD
ncbi:endonuclease [Massilia sp. Dwa41.01b]|uniref:endonuclease/exonuclease/phosphatase family protein n=1 Tax=Massilia sp. Dwa41.01b TaxID=2709302 RepID=UPI0016039B2F|nr:endonuclease/exonuclease/phosphatase family protein [Massilia sp. Dwa41.01b]QNA88819.1 endonuclease [Massilia sp. Dwa41.01b]